MSIFKKIPLLFLMLGLLSGIKAYAAPMTFEADYNGGNCDTCEWITARGEITADTPAKFQEFLKTNPGGSVIHMDSSGGNLTAAIELGKLIREKKYDTSVMKIIQSTEGSYQEEVSGGVCMDACILAFMGGKNRSTWFYSRLEAGKIGISQSLNDMIEADNSIASKTIDKRFVYESLLKNHALTMGVSSAVIDLMNKGATDNIRYLSPENLNDHKLTWIGTDFLPWQIEAYNGSVIAFANSNDGTRTVTFVCKAKQGTSLLLTFEPDMEADWVQSNMKFIKDFTILDTTVPASAARFRTINGNRAAIDIALKDNISIAHLQNNAPETRLKFNMNYENMPKIGSLYDFPVSPSNLRNSFSAVLKGCN